MTSNAGMTWGKTSLIPTRAQEAEFRNGTRPYLIEASADGLTFGNPEAIITAIRSHLQDGSLAEVTSYGNRQGTVRLRVTARDYAGLNAGGMALAAENNVPGYSTLAWTPNVALAVPTVFDVVYSTLPWEFDDATESKVGNRVLRRQFVATFELLPFGRDANLTTVTATSGQTAPPVTPPTLTVIDSGASITGWDVTTTGFFPVLVAKGFGDGKIYGDNGGSVESILFERTTPGYNLGTDRVFAIDYSYLQNDGGSTPPTVTVNRGTGAAEAKATLVQVGPYPASGVGYYRAFYQLPASTIAAQARLHLLFPTVAPFTRVSIDTISRATSVPAISGTNRQRQRSLTVGGSARARAALAITAEAGKTLGDLTLLYTRTGTTGLQPPLRTYRSSSSLVSPDPTSVSGAYNTLATPMVFLLPANRFKEAAHDLIARLRSTVAGPQTITWTAELASAANADIPESAVSIGGSTTVDFAVANQWQTDELGLLQLPTVPVAVDSTHVIRLTLLADATVTLDEAWLFDLDNGVLSWVDTTGLTRLEVRTADLTNPEPSYWGSTTDGGTPTAMVRADWRVHSFGSHVFEPGPMEINTTTSGTEGSSCTAMYYRSWLHSAAA